MNQVSSSDPKIILNPFYAVNIRDDLFSAPAPKASHEDWILLNANLILDIGATAWLNEFLDVISQSNDEYDGHDIINPTLTISLSPELQGAHDPLVERSDWIAANAKLLGEMDAAKWLERLLQVLAK